MIYLYFYHACDNKIRIIGHIFYFSRDEHDKSRFIFNRKEVDKNFSQKTETVSLSKFRYSMSIVSHFIQ